MIHRRHKSGSFSSPNFIFSLNNQRLSLLYISNFMPPQIIDKIYYDTAQMAHKKINTDCCKSNVTNLKIIIVRDIEKK